MYSNGIKGFVLSGSGRFFFSSFFPFYVLQVATVIDCPVSGRQVRELYNKSNKAVLRSWVWKTRQAFRRTRIIPLFTLFIASVPYIYIHIYTFPQLSIIFINPRSNLFLSNFPFENNISLSFEGLEKKLYSKILAQTRVSFYLTLSNRVIIEITH